MIENASKYDEIQREINKNIKRIERTKNKIKALEDMREHGTFNKRCEMYNKVDYLQTYGKILKNNLYIILYNDNVKNIKKVLTKYKGKQVGTITRQKIQSEIVLNGNHLKHAFLFNDEINLLINDGFGSDGLKIYTNYFNCKKTNYIDENNSITSDYNFNINYNHYIENIDEFIKNQNTLAKQINKKADELHKLFDEYNKIKIRNIEAQTYKDTEYSQIQYSRL